MARSHNSLSAARDLPSVVDFGGHIVGETTCIRRLGSVTRRIGMSSGLGCSDDATSFRIRLRVGAAWLQRPVFPRRGQGVAHRPARPFAVPRQGHARPSQARGRRAVAPTRRRARTDRVLSGFSSASCRRAMLLGELARETHARLTERFEMSMKALLRVGLYKLAI